MVSSSRHLLSGSSSSHPSPSTDENKPISPTLDPDYDDDDDDDGEVTVQEVQNRILRDQVILKILQEQEQQKDTADVKVPAGTSTDARNRRKKLARSQEIILKHMLKITKECGVKAFVYGIVPDSGKPISAASDNLRGWWQERVKFDHSAPAAIAKYEHDAGVIGGADSPNAPPAAGPSSLTELQDQTLGSMLSALLQHCSPPQRKFPLDNGIAPPWWPTGNEEWWPALGFAEGMEGVPYRKPHDLKKAIKCGVIMAVLRHMLPKVEEVLTLVRSSRGLQDKMSAKEMHVWFSVVKREEELFWERNEGLSRPHRSTKPELADLIETGGGGCDEVESDVNKGGASSDERRAIDNLMSLYEELGSCGDASQTLDEREKKVFDARVESLSQDLLKLIDSDAVVPTEFPCAAKPFRFARRGPNESRIDDEMKQMEMRQCLQLQQVEMKRKMTATKRMSRSLHAEMSQSLKQQQIDMSQNMPQNFAFGQQQSALQQDQLAEISSGYYDQNQSQRHFPSANNFSGNYDNSMQARNGGTAENQNMSTEMGYEFDEFELDYLIASADAFMHDI